MNKKVKIILYIVLEICMIFSIIYILKYCYDMFSLKGESNLLNEISTNEIEIADENNVENQNIEEPKTEKMLKLEKLQEQYSDIKAWIEIKDTKINFPVLQGTDNNYYLKHNYKKEYSTKGSIFLDKAYSWDPPSSNLLIYGHDSVFKDLFNYTSKEFYKAHPVINFTTNKEDAEYEIIAVFRSRVYYKDEKNVFRYYYFVNSKNEKDYNEFVNNSKKASLYDTGKTAKYGEQLLTLSTCSYHTKDGRFVIVARKKNEQTQNNND